MKKVVLLLAILFLIGALAGTATALGNRKDDNIPSGGAGNGGGSGSGASLEGLETDFGMIILKEAKLQSYAGVGGGEDTLTLNTESNGWALYSDSGYDILVSRGVLSVENTSADGALSFYMSKNYDRQDPAFSASFLMGKGTDEELLDCVFYCSLEDSPGTEDRVSLLTIRDGDLYAVDKNRGEVKIDENVGDGNYSVKYHVDLKRQSLQVWVGVTYKGAYSLASSSAGDITASSYFGFYAAPNPENVGKKFSITYLYIYC